MSKIVETTNCTFCPSEDGCYERRNGTGEYVAACFECACKPYPVPKQFLKADSAPAQSGAAA